LGSNRDKYLHLLIFMLFAFLWRLAGWSINRVLIAGIIYAGLIEIMQALIPAIHRSGEWLDFAADAVGVAIGLLLARLGTRWIGPQ
jgi:VanZ family protein